jgi:hypothetical protein
VRTNRSAHRGAGRGLGRRAAAAALLVTGACGGTVAVDLEHEGAGAAGGGGGSGAATAGTAGAPADPVPPGAPQWGRRFGDADNQYASALVVDPSGDLVLAGHFYGGLDFGGGELHSAGYTDIYLARLGPEGGHVFSRRYGDAQPQYANALAIDGSSNILMAGFFQGSVDFGGGALQTAGDWDVLVAKLDATGHPLWARRFGDEKCQQAYAVAVDADDDVALAGVFYGTIDFGQGALPSHGERDLFVAKLDPNGAVLWAHGFGGVGYQDATSVAFDQQGNVVVVGVFDPALDFGAGLLPNGGGRDAFVAKLDPDGQPVWSRSFGSDGDQAVEHVAVDSAGSLLLAGHFSGSVDFGGGVLVSQGARDAFVVKLDPDGQHLWSRSFGDAGDQAAMAVALDAQDDVLVSGEAEGAIGLDGATLQGNGGMDAFVIKLDPGGNVLWGRSFGDSDWQVARGVAADTTGDVAVAAHFQGSVEVH